MHNTPIVAKVLPNVVVLFHILRNKMFQNTMIGIRIGILQIYANQI